MVLSEPNGAGKSTLLRAISGELEPNKGTVELAPGERLSVLEQDHFKYDEYSVMDTVLMGHQPLWKNMKEREALYAKDEMTEEDGNRAAEPGDGFCRDEWMGSRKRGCPVAAEPWCHRRSAL